MTSIKKVLILYIFILAFPTWGGQFVLEAKKDVLIFMMADNDLVQQAHDDLEEIENVLPTMKHTNVFIDVHLPGHSFRQINHEKTKIAPTKTPIQKLKNFFNGIHHLKQRMKKFSFFGDMDKDLYEFIYEHLVAYLRIQITAPHDDDQSRANFINIQAPSLFLICVMQNLSVFII